MFTGTRELGGFVVISREGGWGIRGGKGGTSGHDILRGTVVVVVVYTIYPTAVKIENTTASTKG